LCVSYAFMFFSRVSVEPPRLGFLRYYPLQPPLSLCLLYFTVMVIMINDVCWSDRGCGLVSFGVFWVGRCYGCVVSCGFVFGVFVSMYFVHCFVGFSCCSWAIIGR
jgi:hypothetical protein